MELTFDQRPWAWPVCFIDKCPDKEQCLRHRVALLAPEDVQFAFAVTPAVLKKKPCPMFRKEEIMRAAKGMTRLLMNVKSADLIALRAQLRAYLGGRTAYYRYWRGEYVLTPEQQADIADIFRTFGYNEPPLFDSYEERFRFDD